MQTHSRLGALLGGALLALLPSCGNTQGSRNVVEYGEGQHELTELQGSPKVTKYLEIRDYRSRRVDGLLQVGFELHNKRGSELDFSWAVDWFDAEGFRIENGTRRWEPVKLAGGGIESIQVTSPTPEAAELRMQFAPRDEVH